MEFYGAVERVEHPPYGPRYRTTSGTETLIEKYGDGLDQWQQQLHFVANRVSTKTVRELEALCTLIYVATDEASGMRDTESWVAQVRALKPHLTDADLARALDEYLALTRDAQHLTSPAYGVGGAN